MCFHNELNDINFQDRLMLLNGKEIKQKQKKSNKNKKPHTQTNEQTNQFERIRNSQMTLKKLNRQLIQLIISSI